MGPACDAGSASRRRAAGRLDPGDDRRAALRREVEEGVLRIAGARVGHRDGRLRRLGERRLLRRRQLRPSAAARQHRPGPLRQGEIAGGGGGPGAPPMDRASRARARVDLILRGSRVQMPAVRYRFEAKAAAAVWWRGRLHAAATRLTFQRPATARVRAGLGAQAEPRSWGRWWFRAPTGWRRPATRPARGAALRRRIAGISNRVGAYGR